MTVMAASSTPARPAPAWMNLGPEAVGAAGSITERYSARWSASWVVNGWRL
jgi:hypothetical protein